MNDSRLGALAIAAEGAAARWNEIVSAHQTETERAAALLQAVEEGLSDSGALLTQGGFADWMTRAGESLKRAAQWPGDAISTVFAELRPALNEAVSNFFGDVVTYLNTRDAQVGPSPMLIRVLDALAQAHQHKQANQERIVVVTHSMGGQLFYDAVSYYAARDPRLANLTVDHWITCGSQVSFFAELGLFKGQDGTRAPNKLKRPQTVAKWTNYYDPNDFLGFVMQQVFEGVRDEPYNTGYGLAFAHSGFLARPSFFKAVATAL